MSDDTIDMLPDVVGAAEVASILGVALNTVYAYRRDGILPEATLVGRTPIWSREAIERFARTRQGRGRPAQRWVATDMVDGVVIDVRSLLSLDEAWAWMEQGRTGSIKIAGHAVEYEFRDGVGDTPEGWR